MQLQKLVNMFGGDLTRRYGQKVHKLTLHGGFSCPNRDGTIGRGGCTFCNVASFADEAQQHRSIAEQLAHQANLVNRAKRYLAYFQAYTSTFAEVQVLRSMYQQAVSQANIVGLCVGTRPDCVPDAVLDPGRASRQRSFLLNASRAPAQRCEKSDPVFVTASRNRRRFYHRRESRHGAACGPVRVLQYALPCG